MYNLVGLAICLLFATISTGWRGKMLPIIICIYYLLSMLIEISQFSILHTLSDTIAVSDRDVADSFILTYNALAILIVFVCCISALFNHRNTRVTMAYAAWLLVVVFLNTAIHINNWEGDGTHYAIIAAFQLSCVAVDGAAAMLGGDNCVGRRVVHYYRGGTDSHRRHYDSPNKQEVKR
ncbi:hypothetical protein N9980_00545 [bacterium]|nr:hypothetical protein [bacterium]